MSDPVIDAIAIGTTSAVRHSRRGPARQVPFTLPLNIITETIAILAKRGAGKTYLMRKLAETMIGAHLPVVIIDPIGVCWGLRSSSDGEVDGLPVIIFGGDHGDLPLEEASGKVLADWVVAERRPVVLDLSGFASKKAERRFVADFAERIYRRNRDPLHIMLDEADAFAPQQPQAGDQRMLGAINTLARRGRARGIGLSMATQRSAVLNKNVLTQAEILVAMRMTAPQDRKAIEEWIRYHGDRDDRDTVLGTLGELPVGEAWFWSPGLLGGIHRVKVGRCETFDSSATPKAGEVVARPKLGPVDLPALSEHIQATVERAEAEDPAVLRKRIAELERKLKDEPRKADPVEVPVVHQLALERAIDLRLKADELHRVVGELRDFAGRLEAIVRKAPIGIVGERDEDGAPPRRLRRTYPTAPITLTPDTIEVADAKEYNPDHLILDGSENATTVLSSERWDAAAELAAPGPGRKLKRVERRVLTALAQHGPCDKRRLAAITGYKASGGGFQNGLSALRTAGDITRGEPIDITDEGRRSLGPLEPLPRGVELLEMWEGKLAKAPRLCLRALYDAYPRELSKDELAGLTGYAPTGGGFQNALSKLSTLGLMDRNGSGLRATENLFR